MSRVRNNGPSAEHKKQILEMCEKHGIKYYSVYRQLQRYNLNMTVENVKKYFNKDNIFSRHPFKLFGKTYRTKNDFAKEYGISLSSLKNILKNRKLEFNEKNIQRYLNGEFKAGYGSAKSIQVNGKKYMSIRDFCKKNNLYPCSIYKYFKNHKLELSNNEIEKWFNKVYLKTNKRKNISKK